MDAAIIALSFSNETQDREGGRANVPSLFAVKVMAALPERWNAGLEILVRAWRQAALAGTAIVLAQMGNIALARIPGDRTTDRCLARGQYCGKKPGIGPDQFLQRRLPSGT